MEIASDCQRHLDLMDACKMRPSPLLLSFFLTAACNSSVSQLSSAAESARTATEHAADRTDAANFAKEAKIFDQARSIDAQAKNSILENGGRPRYEIRKDRAGDSWTVYDTENNVPARLGPSPQSGMSHADAEAAFASLQQQDQNRSGGGPQRGR